MYLLITSLRHPQSNKLTLQTNSPDGFTLQIGAVAAVNTARREALFTANDMHQSGLRFVSMPELKGNIGGRMTESPMTMKVFSGVHPELVASVV